jgi:hypothetical protein
LPNHRVLVARGFKIIGLATALLSSLTAITIGIAACKVAPSASQPSSEYLSVTHYGLVALLANAATGGGEILSVLNDIAAAIVGLIAMLALIFALLGVLLFVIGRGLRDAARWARYMAGAVMMAALLTSLSLLSVLEGAVRLAAAVVPFVCVYVLWVLKARYSDGSGSFAASQR